MLHALASSLAAKLLAGTLALAGTTEAISQVTGTSTHDVLASLLRFLAATGAAVAAVLIRDLRAKIETGDTPSTQVAEDVRGVVLDLREVVLELREGLARAGTLERREPPDPPGAPQRREDDTT